MTEHCQPDEPVTPGVGLVTRLAIVVINWHSAHHTREFIRLVRQSHTSDEAHVVVVDNNSSPTSLAEASAAAMKFDGVTLLQRSSNGGFAGGMNTGLEWALGRGFEFVAISNTDVSWDGPLFDRLVEALSAGTVDAVSPRIVTTGGTIWFAGAVLDRSYGAPRHLQEPEIRCAEPVERTELLTGCLMVASAAVWRDVGMLDERLFLIFEDSDWSMRAALAERRLGVVMTTELRHEVSRWVGPANSPLATYFFTRNGLEFARRYGSVVSTLRFAMMHVVLPQLRDWRRFRPWTEAATSRVLGCSDFVRGRFGDCPQRFRVGGPK